MAAEPRFPRVRAWRARYGDALLAAAISVFVLQNVWTESWVHGSRPFLTLTSLAMTVPLAWRRRAPLAVAAITAAALLLQVAVEPTDHPVDAQFLAWIVASYSLGVHADLRAALAGEALLIVAVDLWAYHTGDDLVFVPLILIGFALVGRVVRSRNRLTEQLRERTRELELEREERARLAVAQERSRIARELHDIVSHTLSVIVVQAGAERLTAPAGPTRDTLEAVENEAREALAEMGRLLGMLRADGEDALRPPPGLERLDELLARVRDTGLVVDLVVEGAPRSLAPGLDVSAYRILQEALTNTIRHARATRVRVRLHWEPNALELEVADDGAGPAVETQVPSASGHGLLGVRERVALFGGALVTGRSDLGGYVLTARLPLGPA